MKRLAAVFALAAASALGAPPAAFQWRAEIEAQPLGAEGPVRVVLGAEALALTRVGLPDLRIVRDDGQEVPHAIYERRLPPFTPESFPFRVLSYEPADHGAVIVVERPAGAPPFSRIELATAARDFRKAVEVEAGPEASAVKPLARDVIFDFSSRIDARRTTIDVPETDARVVRLTIRDEPPPDSGAPAVTMSYDGLDLRIDPAAAKAFRIDAITGRRGVPGAGSYVYDERAFPEPAASTDRDGNSLIELGALGLPAGRVIVATPTPYYYRAVEAFTETPDAPRLRLAAGILCRAPGMARPQDELALDGRKLATLSLRILNRDNPPLPVASVRVLWRRRVACFFAEPGRRYAVLAGSPDVAPADHEVRRLLSAEQANAASVPEWQVGAFAANPAYAPGAAAGRAGRERIERLVLVVVVASLGLLMAAWLVSLARRVPRDSSPA